MTTINLLPESFSSKGVVKVARIVKKILVPLFAVFFISVTVILSVIMILSSNLKKTAINQEVLTTSIKSLEKTERGMLLLQERLSKIKKIEANDPSKGKITQNFQDVFEQSADVTVSDVKLAANNISFEASTPSSDQLGQFLSNILESSFYKEIVLKDLSYNPFIGYSLGLDLKTK